MLIPRLNACVLKLRLSFLIAIILTFVGFAISGVQSARAATFTVINTNDSGDGFLRQAILDANSTAGADTITFNIPTSDSNYDSANDRYTITPATAFAIITDDVTINGLGKLSDDGTEFRATASIDVFDADDSFIDTECATETAKLLV